jgi:hypothetical protein
MKLPYKLENNLTWLLHTIYFLKRHYAAVLTLGPIAAFGRVLQLGGFGEVPAWMNVVLEVVVESARVLLFLFVLGFANVRKGVARVRNVFADKERRKLHAKVALRTLKRQCLSVGLNITRFLLIAAGINYLIDLLAYETCLCLALKKEGVLVDSSSEWTVLLFFKNISVIPFTLVFEAVFLLWVTDRLQHRANVGLR